MKASYYSALALLLTKPNQSFKSRKWQGESRNGRLFRLPLSDFRLPTSAFRLLLWTLAVCCSLPLAAQPFYFGVDLSYVNEMEDCGVVYRESSEPVDPYALFADHGANLVRLRLWHTPAWYDDLNSGNRYSDLADVRRSIARAKAEGMQVLLDFHLSDTWADPANQEVPAAWAGVVNNLPLLKDSLYQYIYGTLTGLHEDGLLPEMVQIGNETNKGILQSAADDDGGWKLDWPRNAELFNAAISAVRAVETASGQSIKIVLHVAGPKDADWLMKGFWDNGVRDFDVIGLSYYWAWHQPTTIAATGGIIADLRARYSGKDVMIVETGYIWTTTSRDNANNVINVVNPGYSPASPANQKRWLIDLTQEVINRGGKGVIYWEPAWVSSSCRTLWGQGSHYENTTFFDFNANLLPDGGIGWLSHDYLNLSSVFTPTELPQVTIISDRAAQRLIIEMDRPTTNGPLTIQLHGAEGRRILQRVTEPGAAAVIRQEIPLPDLPAGLYFVTIAQYGRYMASGRVFWW